MRENVRFLTRLAKETVEIIHVEYTQSLLALIGYTEVIFHISDFKTDKVFSRFSLQNKNL